MIRAITADITTLDVDAIVNAANEHLRHGGGVAAAISAAGGPEVQRESDDWVRDRGPLHPGTAAVTTAGEMPARMVIHVAGPRYRDGQDNEALLRTAVGAALDAADAEGAGSVALPAISAGVFGYPLREAAAVITAAAQTWCERHDGAVQEVLLVGYSEPVTAAFRAALGE